MLTDNQINELRQAIGDYQNRIQLTLAATSPDDLLGRELKDFVSEIKEHFPAIEISEIVSDSELSYLALSGPHGEGVRYAALPLDGEWAPFIATLAAAADIECQTLKYTQQYAARFKELVLETEVYVTPQCPHCAQMVTYMNAITLLNEGLTTWIIDASRFMKRATELGIRSTPTLVIDKQIRWVGQTKLEDLLTVLGPDPQPWVTTLKSQLTNGTLEDLLPTLIEKPDAIRALPKLLQEQEISLHMSVLRIVEELTVTHHDLACLMGPSLCELLRNDQPQIRGDAAYAIGLLGDECFKEVLRNCLGDPDPDVRETIEEAIEMIAEQNRG